MERRKRVYPNRKEQGGWLRWALIALTALVVLSGAIEKRSNDFTIEPQREARQPALEEAFDETLTEAVIDLQPYSWHALQVGAFENEETAKQSSVAFQKRGAAGYLWVDGRYRVLAAVYPEKEDAQQVRRQLQDQHGIDSYLYEISMPALKLRMQGMQGQLDIFQAALSHAHDLALQLQRLSVQMDRQELSASEAADALKALKEQMEIVVLRMEQRFSQPQNPTVQALVQCFRNYIQFVSELPASESAISMGMKLKYQVFNTLADVQKVYATLEYT